MSALIGALKIAFRSLIRRKFFTFVSLFGIAFTLLCLLVAAAFLDHSVGPQPPESFAARSLYVQRSRLAGEHSIEQSDAGYGFLDKNVRNLPGAESVTLFTMGDTAISYVEGRKITSRLKRVDGAFWSILDMRFLEGGPFTGEDDREARLSAVITRGTRDRFFGGASALGRTIELSGQRLRVVGVVEDVSPLRNMISADVYAPIGTIPGDAWRGEAQGNFGALILARTPKDFPALKAELASRVKRFPIADPKTFKTFEVPADSLYGMAARGILNEGWSYGKPGLSPSAKLSLILGAAALLFMALPAINLINVNLSRMLERAPEIGVRRAFGATRGRVIGQLVVENLMLTLIGGALAAVLAALVLAAITASGAIPYAHLTVNVRILLWGLGAALVFGLLSGVLPAWRMSRLHPVEALKGACVMMGQLFKLAWRRKASSSLLLVELLASFVVVFVVATSVVYTALCWRMPLGYQWRNVWRVGVERVKTPGNTWSPEDVQGYARLLREGASIEGVAAIAGARSSPYDHSTWTGDRAFGGRQVQSEFLELSDTALDVLHLTLVRGRWFEPADDALPWFPVVVTERFAREAFGSDDPIGKSFGKPPDDRDERIVGVVSELRKGGEFSIPVGTVIERARIGRNDARPPGVLLVRAAPGVDAGFEERLVTRLHAIMPEWTFTPTALEDMRAESIRERFVVFALGATIAGFLLLMVALGLIGVLWQNVTRRTREFGLRRAAGASQGDIRRQVIMEVVLTAAFALGIGAILAAQIPFLGIVPFVGAGTIAAGAAVSGIIVLATVIAAGLYPSVLATRIHPADALRDE